MSASEEEWKRLCSNVDDCGKRIFDGADVNGVAGAADPKFIALALLARTLSNFDAAIELLNKGYIVEARTLTRCCFENLFWIGGLQANGADFVRQIEQDEVASRKRRGKWLQEWKDRQKKLTVFNAKQLQAYMEWLEKAFPKPKLIQFAEVARSTLVRDAYIFYSQLSADAAHPSASSLERYISTDRKAHVVTLHADPKMRPEEVIETMEFACNALLGVCVGANEISGGSPAGRELSALFEQYRALSKKSKSGTQAATVARRSARRSAARSHRATRKP